MTRRDKGSNEDKTKPDINEFKGFIKKDKKENGYNKAAKFLLLLKKEDTVKVLKHLKEEEIEEISKQIAEIRKIDRDEAEKILKEFGVIKKKGVYTGEGGHEAAKNMLKTAFGEEKGMKLFKKVFPYEGQIPFDFLNEIENHQVLLLVKKEPSTVLSIILPHLEPEKSSYIIEALSSDTQKDVIQRIAKMNKVAPEVIVKIEGVLKERIRTQGKVISKEIDGKSTLADILKHMSFTEEQQILEDISQENAELSEEIKDRLFTIDLILLIDDQDMQNILRDYDDSEIAVILKGKTEEMKNKILNNISERRKGLILEETAHIGIMRKADVDKYTKEFLDYITTLEEEEKFIIHRANDTFI